MTLYEITAQYGKLLELMEDPDADPEELTQAVQNLDDEFDQKVEGCVRVIKQMEADADALKNEIARLQARKRRTESSIEQLKNYVKENMVAVDTRKVKTLLFTISVAKSPDALKMKPFASAPERFLIPQEPKVDNAAIKQALKNGETIEGFYLESGTMLRIK